MKTKYFQNSLLAIATVTTLAFTAGNVAAQDSTAAPVQPAAASQSAPQLSYGVPQVLQLVQAKISDGIIVNYIQNSGTIYGLNAGEIVYLKQQGASDTVLNAMLNQRSRLTGSSEPATTTASAPAASDQTYATTAPTVTYVQPAQSSTVYIIPDTQTYQYDAWYYGGYPYYGYPAYGYYGYPAVSFSFGFGNHWGGYHGGGYHGGGYHGGGFNGGGFNGGGHHR
jgi:uncharacterized membrane protein YgcG